MTFVLSFGELLGGLLGIFLLGRHTSSLLESFISGSRDICHPLCILFFSSHIIFRFCSGLPFAWRCGRSHSLNSKYDSMNSMYEYNTVQMTPLLLFQGLVRPEFSVSCPPESVSEASGQNIRQKPISPSNRFIQFFSSLNSLTKIVARKNWVGRTYSLPSL